MTLLKDIVARKRPDVPEIALVAAREWFEKNRDNFSNSCNFAIVTSNGKVTSNLQKPCHATINSTAIGEVEVVATDIAIDRRENWFNTFTSVTVDKADAAKKWAMVDWELVEPCLNYFLYESYFSPFILNKDDIEFVKKYGIIVTADIPAALLQNIMISSRYFIECSPYSFKMFNELLNKGVHPDVAYVVAFHTGMSSWTSFRSDPSTTYVTSVGSHRSTPLLSKQGMLNMINDDFGEINSSVLTQDKNYRKYSSYLGGSQFFGSGNFIKELLFVSVELREELSRYRKEKNARESYTPPNPFQQTERPKGDPSLFTYDEMFECLVPFIDRNNLLEK